MAVSRTRRSVQRCAAEPGSFQHYDVIVIAACADVV
jgi:hypothetical protein